MDVRWRCANMAHMGEIQDRLLAEVGELASELMKAEEEVARIRALLHAKIREAGDKPNLGPEYSGPSAIARAAHHRYTREYVSDLLKKGKEGSDARPTRR
jgi:hypothetical protein